MTREEAIDIIKHILEVTPKEPPTECDNVEEWLYEDNEIRKALDMAIKAIEQKPYEKFESVKDHICKLAGDYKCWDNRLTADEAIELCRILEQEPCEDAVSRPEVIDELNRIGRNAFKEDTDYDNFFAFLDSLPPVTPQEPKPMVEIDLYSVIKQKYIEREVLDKIYADIQKLRGCSCTCSDGIIDDVEDILDKYKAESEEV